MAAPNQPRRDPVPCTKLPYKFHVVMQPYGSIGTAQVVYPPIIVRVVLPDRFWGASIRAQAIGVEGSDFVREGILMNNGSLEFGRVIDAEIPYIPSSAPPPTFGDTRNPNSSSVGSLEVEAGEHAMYFVFDQLTISGPGYCKVRLSLWDMSNYEYMGDIETALYNVTRSNVKPNDPSKSSTCLPTYLLNYR